MAERRHRKNKQQSKHCVRTKREFIYPTDHVTVICRIHGDFPVVAQEHLEDGIGCPRCDNKSLGPAIAWMDHLMLRKPELKIKHARNGGQHLIPQLHYLADGYDEKTNTIYEYLEDYWNGNPGIFNAESMNRHAGMTFKELREMTIQRRSHLIKLGYNIMSIWECDCRTLIEGAAARERAGITAPVVGVTNVKNEESSLDELD